MVAPTTGFYPFEVNAPHLAYTLLGGFTVFFGMFSAFIREKIYLGEAPIATVFGIILGPHCANLINPYSWGGGDDDITDEITLEVTRVIIAISVFAVGVELPKKYMLRHWRTLFFLLIPCMLWGWFVSALLMWALIPGLRFLSCLVIAAAVTPTDPILAQSVVGGKFADKHVPAHIRHMLSAESGSNDGAAFPFLYIGLFLTLDASPGHAIGEWFYATLAYEIVLGTILGALVGYLGRKIMQFAEKRKLIDRQSFVAQYIALALFSMGGTVLLGSDDLLSAFACGCAFAWDGYFNQQTEDAVFSNVADLLFNITAFVYIGALLPFPSFNDHHIGLDWWRLVVLALAILLLRRIPSVLLLYKFIPDIKTFREALFTGWFGPMGVGAVFISTLARHSLPEGEGDTAQVDHVREVITPITLFLVLASILTHGLSIPFFSLGRRVHSITYTWSRQPSVRDNQPAWTTHIRHVQPGQSIIVNRDDDAEDGDIGLRRISPDGSSQEKGRSSGEGSSGSGRNNDVEMDEKRPRDAGAERDQEGEDGAVGERARRDQDRVEDDDQPRPAERSRTPELARYREGDDLIIERRRRGSQEVEVEVIKHHYRQDADSLTHRFAHPHRLDESDINRLKSYLPKISHHMPAFDLHKISSRGSLVNSQNGSRAPTPSGQREEEEEEAGPSQSPAPSPRPEIPRLDIADSPKPRQGLRQRWFGAKRAPSPPVESGLRNPMLLSPVAIRATDSPAQMSPSTPGSPSSNRNPLELTRTQSVNRTIRFARDATNDSDTAPGPGNYGNTQPGFRKNPGLAMFRSASVKSQEEEEEE